MSVLRIPAGAVCLVPGCPTPPEFILSVRMRRQDTGASWAPNTKAFFCDRHANSGCRMRILFEPTTSSVNVIDVAVVGDVVTRTTKIK